MTLDDTAKILVPDFEPQWLDPDVVETQGRRLAFIGKLEAQRKELKWTEQLVALERIFGDDGETGHHRAYLLENEADMDFALANFRSDEGADLDFYALTLDQVELARLTASDGGRTAPDDPAIPPKG